MTREILSYDKNLLTGSVDTKTKNKKDTGIRGKVLIELFEADTNEKIREVYTENIIPDVIFKEIFLRVFTGGAMGVGGIGIESINSLYDWSYLTDSIKPESPNSEKVLGNLIGYAHRNETYSGVSTKRGTINRLETKLEIKNNKIKVNFVFDFPTHAANGSFESIYWGSNYLRTLHVGPPIAGRSSTNGDGDIYGDANTTTDKDVYWSISYFMHGSYSKHIIYTDYYKGYGHFDATSDGVNSSYFQFSEDLKGHQLMVPFDVNLRNFADWSRAIKLLDDSGDPFPKSDLNGAYPIFDAAGQVVEIIGWYYTTYSGGKIKTYRWNKVGVLQNSYEVVDISTTFQDAYGTNFVLKGFTAEPIYWGGQLELYGYHSRIDDVTKETIYSNRLIKFNFDCTYHSEKDLKPKIGNSLWFVTKGMDSGNIERRCKLDAIRFRTKNRLYLYFTGVNGGTSFYQVITPEGNLLEPCKSSWDYSDSYNRLKNIIGTDKWVNVYRKHDTYSDYRRYYYRLNYGAPFHPCGAHTKLVNPVEKTDANTMKIQYMFEIDLVDYTNDLY